MQQYLFRTLALLALLNMFQPALAQTPNKDVGQKAAVQIRQMDLNEASLADLVRLPGVGPALAKSILAYRSKSAFRSIDDLLKVPGIGPKKLAKMRSYLKVTQKS